MSGPPDVILLLIAGLLASYLAARAAARRQVRKVAEWMRLARAGQAESPPRIRHGALLSPLFHEVQSMTRELLQAQEIAGQEARLRRLGDTLWTAERLREHVRSK